MTLFSMYIPAAADDVVVPLQAAQADCAGRSCEDGPCACVCTVPPCEPNPKSSSTL